MVGIEKEKITEQIRLGPEQLQALWADHLDGEFVSKDVEATLETMVDDAYVNHMPVNTGGRGKAAKKRCAAFTAMSSSPPGRTICK